MRNTTLSGRPRPGTEPKPVRPGTVQGEQHGAALLSESEVLEIRRRGSAGEYGTAIAADYGMSSSAVYQILRRKTWRHI